MHRLVCIACAYVHVVNALEKGEDPGPPPTFDQTPLQHMASHHPDPAANDRERAALNARVTKLPAEAFQLLNFNLGNAMPPKERH